MSNRSKAIESQTNYKYKLYPSDYKYNYEFSQGLTYLSEFKKNQFYPPKCAKSDIRNIS